MILFLFLRQWQNFWWQKFIRKSVSVFGKVNFRQTFLKEKQNFDVISSPAKLYWVIKLVRSEKVLRKLESDTDVYMHIFWPLLIYGPNSAEMSLSSVCKVSQTCYCQMTKKTCCVARSQKCCFQRSMYL